MTESRSAVHPQGNGTGPLRAWRAFKCSIQGLKAAFVNESAFRQELFLACLFVPAAFYVSESLLQTLFLITLVTLVLIVELLNTAVEAVVDRISPETHPLSGVAKDVGSAAVLLSLTLAGVSFAASAWAKFL